MFYDITPDEIRQVQAWLDDENAPFPEGDAVSKLLNISDALRRKVCREYARERARNASLSRKLGAKAQFFEKRYEGGEFDCLGYDSIEVAYCIAYCLRERNMRYTMGHLVNILYLVYASWLFHHKERICVEHPVSQSQGPWFWKVAKKAAVFSQPERWWLSNLAGKNPGLVEVIRRIVAKWGDEKPENLGRELLKTDPVRNADARNHGGKWNTEITDGDIYVWKRSMAAIK